MEEEPTKQVAEAATQMMEETAKQKRLNFDVDADKYDRLRQLADYAVLEGLITGHPRGNITSFVNWCIEMGEEILQQHALKKRGF